MDDNKRALKVGYYFCLVNSDESKHIGLENTGVLVKIDGSVYELYRGTNFEESQKIDQIMDRKTQYGISEYQIEKSKEGMRR